MGQTRLAPAASVLVAAVVWLVATTVVAEIVHLKNGDILHGNVISVNSREITLETPYGRLKIPKSDIQRIDYEEKSMKDIWAGLGKA